MKKIFFYASIYGFLLISFKSESYAFSEKYSFSPRSGQLLLTSQYFSTNQNYSKSGGSFDPLPNGQSFQLANFGQEIHWTPTDVVNLNISTDYSYSESKGSGFKRTNSGFTFVKFGSNINLVRGKKYSIIPHFYFLYPTYRNDLLGDKVANSEGAMEADAGLAILINGRTVKPGGAIGYLYRDGGRSFLLPYSIWIDFEFRPIVLGAELKGYGSISNDIDNNNDSQRIAYQNRVNGGSRIFYSVNPSLLETNFSLKWIVNSSLDLKIGAGTTINGMNTAMGWNVFGSFAWKFYQDKNLIKSNGLSNDQFKEETNDGVDQTLFQAPPNNGSGETEDSMNNNIHDQLNKTEMQIHLKPQKK